MKKIYILLAMVAAIMISSCDCSYEGLIEDEYIPTHEEKDTTSGNVIDKVLKFDNMVATPWIFFENGKKDSIQMESWTLDINTTDLVVYRDSYQSSSRLGKTPNAERYDDPEFKDKFGNMVTRHHYTQKFEFNNFTHSISGAWNTGYLIYNGRQEAFLPEDGLYYELINVSGNTVADTTHFVRNDSIFAKEIVKLTYKATLKESTTKSYTQNTRSWERHATVTVISFVGIVIPSAEEYVPNLKGHVSLGNRFFKKIGKDKDGDVGYWEDGFLSWSDDDYFMLIVHYTVNAKDGKSDESYVGKEIITLSKSEMATPTSADREYNGVMYDYEKKKYIPCHLSEDYSFRYGSRYADGTPATFAPDINGSIMAGIKNFAKDKDASPSPWLETSCAEAQYNGKNYYTITLRSSVHTNVTTIADAALK